MGYAWLLNERDGLESVAARAGTVNKQTRFALDAFQVLPPPILLEDASPRFESIVKRIEPLNPAQPLAEAWEFTAQTTALRRSSISTAARWAWSPASRSLTISRATCTLPMRPLASSIRVPCGDACDRSVPRFL